MKDLEPNSPAQSNKSAISQTSSQSAQAQSSGVSGTFSSLFGFAKNTLNKTLNLGWLV